MVGELEAVGVLERVARLDAEHRLVRDRVGRGQVVHVARAHERQPRIARHRDQLRRDLRLDVDPAVLDLDVDVVLAEDLDELVQLIPRKPLVTVDQCLADTAGKAARERDDPVGVGGELVEVDPGLVPVAVEEPGRDQPDKVVVALVGLGQQRQVAAPLPLRAARRDRRRRRSHSPGSA